jgi:hypothetical protein
MFSYIWQEVTQHNNTKSIAFCLPLLLQYLQIAFFITQGMPGQHRNYRHTRFRTQRIVQ